jgi:hypothetical protein
VLACYYLAMNSCGRSASQPGQGRRRLNRLCAVGALSLLAVAGCASHSPGANTAPAKTSSKAPVKPEPAGKAIALAADASQHITSLTGNLDVAVASQSEHITAALALQLKPTTLISLALKQVGPSGPAHRLTEILTDKALYLKDPALNSEIGKPWLEVTLAELSSKSGVNFASILQSIENENPENQVKLFAASKDVHVVGSQTVDGVPTTEYAGSYTAAAAAAALPAGLHKLLAPMLHLLGSKPVQFRVWIDAQHVTRKAVVDETISGQSAVTTFTITSVNQPVHVTFPPASEVGHIPHV